MDWVFILALVQGFGLKFLMTATDGHHWGAVPVPSPARWTALVAGMAIIWIPFVLVWVGFGHSPADMWAGSNAWWAFGNLIGNAAAIAGWWALLSPLQALVAAALTLRQQRLEQRAQMKYQFTGVPHI